MPFDPTAFPSGPHVYLMYELHLTNLMPMPISLSRILLVRPTTHSSHGRIVFGVHHLVDLA